MDSTSRLRPYTDTNNSVNVKITFQKGEQVEAIWSTDGQRYPGTIVHVYPNDNYEVLFNDGVKSRKKVNQIFKLKIKRRPSRFLPKNLPPARPLQIPSPATAKPFPALIPLKPEVVGKLTPGEKIPSNLNSNSKIINNESDSQSPVITTTSSSKLPPRSLPLEDTERPSITLKSNKRDLNSRNSINSKELPTLTPDDNSGSPSPSIIPTVSDPNSTVLCTKKGFVYVQQPHYSVFDVPTDLGKRRRRVHNYSKLARGPPLKGVIIGGIDGLVDGESDSRPASPASTVSSVSTGRSSPVDVIIGTSPINNRRKRPSSALTNNIKNSVKKVTPNRTPDSKSNYVVVESISSPVKAVCNSDSSRTACAKNICDTDKSTIPLTVTESESQVNIKIGTTNSNNIEGQVIANIEHHESSGLSSKRLRKPSTRFSSEEGYMDVFSSRRTKRTTMSPKEPGSPAFNSNSTSLVNDVTPKLQVQRPRSKNLHHSSKKTKDTKESGPPILFPETEQVHVEEERIHEHLNQNSKDDNEVNNCDQQTNAHNSVTLPEAKNESLINNIDKSKDPVSSQSEESPTTIKDDAFIVESPKKKSSRVSFSDCRLVRSGPPSPVIVIPIPAIAPNDDSVQKCTVNEVSASRISPSASVESIVSSDTNQICNLRGRGRRWMMSSKPDTLSPEKFTESLQPLPSVILNRLPIPELHVLVEKCDSNVRTASSSSTLPSSNDKVEVIPKVNDSENGSQLLNTDLPLSNPLKSSSTGGWTRKKRWGEGKNRWTKPRHKPGGLLPGMRPGMRVKDSLSLQLIKRSRFQRRFEKRGRPKVALLTGITKKKLRKIQDSIKRRKLKKSNISALTKFKDVRVDIINCVCGRVDEFGLMIQCEVCLCWQHGVCFHIQDSSKLPKFYVCQSCKSPKCVRSTQTTEAIRQEAYKKGVLPYYPFAPKPSSRKQKILKACDELSKVIDSIDNSIRQNKIKEQIALAEPDHPKLYQWSTQRPVPKDQIQRWHFNKYFKSVLRRLLARHKRNPAYLNRLRNIINFRDKLKKYSQAFEEARLAIRRKIGPRGLILIEKLSDHQCKIEKITKAKLKQDPQFKKQPAVKPLVGESPSLFPPPGKDNEEKANDRKCVGGVSKLKPDISLTDQLKHLIERYEYLCDRIGSVETDDSDFEEYESNSDSDEKVSNASKSNSIDNLAPDTQIKLEQSDTPNLEVDQSEEEENYKVSSIDSEAVNGLVKTDTWNSTKESFKGDTESEGENTSIDDTTDGEEYWLQPQTEINNKYNKYRKFLLTDEILEDNEVLDTHWTPSKADIVRKDWLWDFNEELSMEDEEIESEELESSSESESENSTVDEEDELQDHNISSESNKIATAPTYWEQTIALLEENEDSDAESDQDWQVDECIEEYSSSETDNDSAEEDLNSNCISFGKLFENDNSQIRVNDSSTTGGIVLLTSDPDVNPGDVVEVLIKEGAHDETIGSGKVIAGGRGQNFIRLIDPTTSIIESTNQDSNNLSNNVKDVAGQQPTTSGKGSHQTRIPLCKSCRETIGSKWTWDELNCTKGVEVVCEDTILSYMQELKKYHTLGLWSAKSNVEVDLNKPCGSLPKIDTCETQSKTLKPAFQPMQLKELCRVAIKTSKTRTETNAVVQDGRNPPSKLARVNPPTSAEEESILSLLSLSKTPVQFNGENVSELSIESLRRLTDQLQCTNGPLSEGLAKAVGQPLVNGKVGLQNCQNQIQHNSKPLGTGATKSNSSRETICVRCNLKGKSSKTLTVLSTFDPKLADIISDDGLLELHKELSEAVRKVRASAHVIKRAVFKKVSVMVERLKAEGIARAKGEKIIPISAQGKLALTKPEEYLHGLKSEYVDALLPYATYFISRFTKRDELNKAKKSWVQDMICKFIIVKKSLKEMYGTDNDEGRTGKEDKFYTALDNLRKSFDIVLTKKDIKMRRQNQNCETVNHLGPNGIRTDAKRTIDSSKSDGPATLVNGDVSEETEALTDGIDVEMFSSVNNMSSKGLDPNLKELSELELLARLATYPIQVEDVNALLGLTSKEVETVGKEGYPALADKNGTTTNGVVTSTPKCQLPLLDGVSSSEMKKTEITESFSKSGSDLPLANGLEDTMEVDITNDMQLLEENLALKTSDNLVIGGDMDLIKAIGTFDKTDDYKETEDSDLLLNVFDDPVFSEPQEEPKPCCSKSLGSSSTQQPKQIAPVLTKLTPEMCRGYLIEDIRAHQHVTDVQLDRVESEIMELERRRGKGLKEKEDDKQFARLYSNMQMLIYNMDVLDRVAEHSIGEDDNEIENETSGSEEEYEEDTEQPEEDDEEMDHGSSTETCPSEPDEIEQVDVDMDPSSSESEVDDLLDV